MQKDMYIYVCCASMCGIICINIIHNNRSNIIEVTYDNHILKICNTHNYIK